MPMYACNRKGLLFMCVLWYLLLCSSELYHGMVFTDTFLDVIEICTMCTLKDKSNWPWKATIAHHVKSMA